MTEIAKLMKECHQTAKDHGWWPELTEGDGIELNGPPRNFGEIVALMHSELSEALEEYRVHGLDPDKFIYEEKGKPEGIAIEFADLMIRMFDNCERYGIPLEAALKLKMKFNESRPFRHGGKLA